MDSHDIKWDLALCLLLAWIIIFFCTVGGVKSVGKVTQHLDRCDVTSATAPDRMTSDVFKGDRLTSEVIA